MAYMPLVDRVMAARVAITLVIVVMSCASVGPSCMSITSMSRLKRLRMRPGGTTVSAPPLPRASARQLTDGLRVEEAHGKAQHALHQRVVQLSGRADSQRGQRQGAAGDEHGSADALRRGAG